MKKLKLLYKLKNGNSIFETKEEYINKVKDDDDNELKFVYYPTSETLLVLSDVDVIYYE